MLAFTYLRADGWYRAGIAENLYLIRPHLYFDRLAQFIAFVIDGIGQRFFHRGVRKIIKANSLCLVGHFLHMFPENIRSEEGEGSAKLQNNLVNDTTRKNNEKMRDPL